MHNVFHEKGNDDTRLQKLGMQTKKKRFSIQTSHRAKEKPMADIVLIT